MKIMIATKKSRKMRKYALHEGLNERMPNYEVKMGFGLHLGWAIEGPIGSYYKIDASYLSPHVRMCETLEGATKEYGIPLLISGSLYDYMSTETQDETRQVDCVLMKGMDEPTRLYTCDIYLENLQLEPEKPPQKKRNIRANRVK